MIFKSYISCGGDFQSYTLPNNRLFTLVSNPYAWFDAVENPLLSSLVGWSFTAPMVDGTYTVTFTELVDGEVVNWSIQIIVTIPCTSQVFDNCCTNQYNLVWINREGGWMNYIFTGVREFTVDVGDAKTFITSDYIQKYSEVSGVYDGVIATTGDIPQSHVDVLASLQYSIQVYLYDESEDTFTEILLDKKNFVKRKSTDKFFDVRIRFIYAEELLIQGQ